MLIGKGEKNSLNAKWKIYRLGTITRREREEEQSDKKINGEGKTT